MKNIHLLVIDPQIDFCDSKGALYVKGAEKDMSRLATFTRKSKDKITDIHVTLDSHHLIDIAHPTFWRDTNGAAPKPFTIITAQDVKDGKFRTTMPSCQKRRSSMSGSWLRTVATRSASGRLTA